MTLAIRGLMPTRETVGATREQEGSKESKSIAVLHHNFHVERVLNGDRLGSLASLRRELFQKHEHEHEHEESATQRRQ